MIYHDLDRLRVLLFVPNVCVLTSFTCCFYPKYHHHVFNLITVDFTPGIYCLLFNQILPDVVCSIDVRALTFLANSFVIIVSNPVLLYSYQVTQLISVGESCCMYTQCLIKSSE